MGAIVLALTWACSTGIITTASRMTWSFARDRGTPFSSILGKVSPRTKVPVIALFTVTGIAALLTLIYVGSYTAFNDVISLTITGFYVSDPSQSPSGLARFRLLLITTNKDRQKQGSYFLPAAFLLYHRIKGHVAPRGTFDGEADHGPPPEISDMNDNGKPPAYRPRGVSVAQAQLIWGPWHIPGILGIINNAYACLYMIFVIFWSVWPPVTPVTASTMNYSIVVTSGVIIFSIVWYYIRGRKEYHGPRIDDEVARVMRIGSIVSV